MLRQLQLVITGHGYMLPLLISGIFLPSALWFVFKAFDQGHLSSILWDDKPQSVLVVSGILYFVSHVIRAVRMRVMLIEDTSSIKSVASVHFLTAWITAALPHKIGEVYRLYLFARLSKRSAVGIMAFALEKICDAFVLLVLAAIVCFGGGGSVSFRFFVSGAVAFLGMILVVWYALPDMIDYGRQLILTQSRSRRGILYLEWMRVAEKFYTVVEATLRFRFGLVLMLSFFCWGIDLLAFAHLASIPLASTTGLTSLFVGALKQALSLPPAWSGEYILEYKTLSLLVLTALAIPSVMYVALSGKKSVRKTTRCGKYRLKG